MQSRRRCILLWLGKYWISRGRNVLLQGNSFRLRFDGLSLRFWQKNKLSQTSTRVHQILIPTHNHEVTHYSPARRWFYQWKWQCSKSWSHSQNSLCSQISIRRGCACGMLDRGCLLWFTTVYYYVNGKTRRIHSRGRVLLSVDHAHIAWCMDFIRDARAGHAINTCTHAKQKTMYTAVIGKILNFSWEKCVTSR